MQRPLILEVFIMGPDGVDGMINILDAQMACWLGFNGLTHWGLGKMFTLLTQLSSVWNCLQTFEFGYTKVDTLNKCTKMLNHSCVETMYAPELIYSNIWAPSAHLTTEFSLAVGIWWQYLLFFHYQSMLYMCGAMSISQLLMPWLLVLPGHQKPWYWQYIMLS